MNKIVIKNYEEFKEFFVREDGKRKNKIILDMWKDKGFVQYIESHPEYKGLMRVKTMADLFALCDFFISSTGEGAFCHKILGNIYFSNLYKQSEGGICADGDYRGYRYVNAERDAIFKMRIGKMYRHFIDSNKFAKALPEAVKLYLCEEITSQWMAHCQSFGSNYTLHVDDDFAKIYNSEYYTGDFNSCMTDDENYHFYKDAVDALAAYLTNNEGNIVARCVIFTKATDTEGKVWRLAERQYSADGDEVYKRMLVLALIQGGHIDGYKKVGAGCHDPKLWMDIHGNKIPEANFSIKCRLEEGDIISYQDSFKWFDYNEQVAYNYAKCGLDDCLSTTNLHLEYTNYDSWNEERTNDDICTVYSGGREYTCSVEQLDSFRYVHSLGEWHHENDVTCCADCGRYYLSDDVHYVEREDDYFCDDCYDDIMAEFADEKGE